MSHRRYHLTFDSERTYRRHIDPQKKAGVAEPGRSAGLALRLTGSFEWLVIVSNKRNNSRLGSRPQSSSETGTS
jgi:hypothetical protein